MQTYGTNKTAEDKKREDMREHVRAGASIDVERLWQMVEQAEDKREKAEERRERAEERHEAQLKRMDETLKMQMETSAIWGALARDIIPSLKGMSDEEIMEKWKARELGSGENVHPEEEISREH